MSGTEVVTRNGLYYVVNHDTQKVYPFTIKESAERAAREPWRLRVKIESPTKDYWDFA